MNRYDFTNRAAVVTGGAQGIGYAVAQRLFEGGARVSLWDRDEAALANARARLGDVQTVLVDLTDRDAVANATSRTLERFGQIDVLVHSAGIAGANATVADYAPEEWSRVIDVDLNAAFHVNQAIVRAMIARGYGRIVNIASIAGKEGNPNASAYSAAKAGVIALTKSLGKETAGLDIAVNAVTPAAARTKIFEQMKQEHIDYMLSKIPRGRFVEVNEIASMVAFLASSENSFTTGAVFDLSGGRATY
ncbi:MULTISPECIES: SDR family NAD(P)-dependent oxidoreductase [Caballeronia]|jgi:3-oxoacyl-[acyl-carrier protein] reductase|uniref:SDR family oxidoreductase n=1 Tax=Caballeronia TaxID=1827195 RepID=UPI00025B9753|nr:MULTISPECIES: SDR family NAD(P)-dependent oxidoreductase [Caballeronia]EKS66482.1 short-chain dehydrogenase/reductase [Burkholderia sp. SJ98]MDR5788954.1 SDR family NAD(P)-dependent oxidoreductase [Caballeronia sp. LP003]MDR5797603.1 SDR family NAD(P)-dependent oxidoreductase [Caballeronia sp. LZ008]